MSKMGSHDPFGHLKHKLWPKENAFSGQVLTTKSRELTRFPCVKVVCDIPLEISWQGLQLCFKSHLNWRSSCKVMGPQSHESPNFGKFKTPTWSHLGVLGQKCHLDVGLVERHRVYYKGEGGGILQVWAVVSFVNLNLLVLCLSTKSAQTMH
jgi:hypothetical protein